MSLKFSRILVAAVIIGSFLVAGLSFLVPVPTPLPTEFHDSDEFRFAIAILAMFVAQYLGATLFFLLGLKGFKTAFKHSYYLICAGLVCEAVYLGLSITGFSVPALQHTILTSGSAIVIGGALLYAGLRHFARLLGVKTWLTSLTRLAVILAAAVVVVWFLPQPASSGSNLGFRLSHMAAATEIGLYAFATLLIWAVRKNTNAAYARPLLWFFIAMAAATVGPALILATDYIALPPAIPLEVIQLPFSFTNLLFLMAGYYFYRLTRQPKVAENHTSSVDIIVYVASLASLPREIDPLLDPLRQITAQRSPEQALSEADEKKLKEVYLQLEDYLVTNERLRDFTRRSLRSMVQERYSQTPWL